MKITLNDRKIRGLSTEKVQEDFWEKNFVGGSFGVRVTRGGRKTFVLLYRKDGRLKRMSLGEYGTGEDQISLADARKDALEKVGEVAAGGDPIEESKEKTFGDLADVFLERYPKQAGLKLSTVKGYERLMDVELLPHWRTRPAKSITRGDVNELLDAIAFDREKPVLANRVLSLMSVCFNYAIDSGGYGVEINPCYRVKKKTREKAKNRNLSDAEIKKLWAVLDQEADETRPVMAALYRLILLTAQRPGEVKQVRWADIGEGVWHIPAEVAKNGREHWVPLSSQVLSLLEDLREETGEKEHVFAGPRGGHIAWFSAATKRITDRAGFKFTPHDLRRTAATGMASLGIHRDTIAKVLNHKTVDRTPTAVYDRYDRLPEMRQALERWGSKVEKILKGKPAKIVRMNRT